MKEEKTTTAEELLDKALNLDRASQESKAIKHYKDAIKLGLPPQKELIAKICLGSSLRVVGKTKESIRVLSASAKKSPVAFLFKALSLHSRGKFEILSRILIKELFIIYKEQGKLDPKGFEKALQKYIKKLPNNSI